MAATLRTLVFFAVPQEARRFDAPPGCEAVITGIGQKAAKAASERAIEGFAPDLVISSGFAGALNPAIPRNALLFNAEAPELLRLLLRRVGAIPARFHCSEAMLITAAEKRAAFERHKCDAVEMESAAIHDVCRRRNIPAITLRVVSDAAGEDLPIDFNRFATPDGRMRLRGLLGHLLLRPALIPKLAALGRQTSESAQILALALRQFLEVGTK